MSIDKVSNSNAGLYASSAAVIGGGAGAAVGWYSKPFLKKGEPTDTFIKKVGENAVNALPDEMKNPINQALESMKNISSVEELKEISIKQARDIYKHLDVEAQKEALYLANEISKQLGQKGFEAEAIESITGVDDVIELVGKNFDEQYAGKTLEEIRGLAKVEQEQALKLGAKSMIDAVWDADNKKFMKFEEEVPEIVSNMRKAVVDAANSLKGKAALIYGLGSAAVLGLGTLIATKALHKPEQASVQNEEKLAETENLKENK